LDVDRVRADFAFLDRPGPNGSGAPVAFLDSAASSQKPRQVLDRMRDTYEHAYANVHRGVYSLAAEATDRYENARAVTQRFLNAASPREVIFTGGTTEAINLVAYSWGRAVLQPGDVIVSTELEHHSNFVPWQQIAAQTGAEVRYLPLDQQGAPQLDALDELVGDARVQLVAVTHVSNALGTVLPVTELADWAHARDALLLVDGAQAMPHRPVDVQALGCDFYAFSAHKALGPSGIGVLWAREQVLRDMPPFQFGGEMIRQVRTEGTTFNDLPWKFEAGTPAIVEAVGMAAALEYLEALGLENVQAHEHELTSYAASLLREMPGVTLLGPGPGEERGGILSFTAEGAHPHDIATILDGQDVCVRAGHHCTQPLMRRLGVGATARASVYVYNTREDVERLADALGELRRVFGLR